MASLTALAELVESEYRVLSPEVGYFTAANPPGTFLSPGVFIGQLRVLNTFHGLYLPKNIQGRLIYDDMRDKIIPVGYGQELFRLNPEQLMDIEKKSAAGEAAAGEPGQEEEGFVITAFTTGIFYSAPSPDAPPFVEVGQKIDKGKALGLIEVMKTFNQILFQGTETSTTGTVKKIYVKDGAEVKSGQPLFLIN